MSEPSPPPPWRLAQFALDVLEEAVHEARDGPIERTTAQRLALGILAHFGIAKPTAAHYFWQLLAEKRDPTIPQDEYLRLRDLFDNLDIWTKKAGLPPRAFRKRRGRD